MFKRLFLCSILTGIVITLTGCNQDDKQAAAIYQKLEHAAALEQNFADIQQKLNKSREMERTVYTQIMNSNITNQQAVKDEIKKATDFNQEQQQILEKEHQKFREAYKLSAAIDGNVEKIKSDSQQKAARDLEQLLEKRDKTATDFFKRYKASLDLNKQLYQQLKKTDFKADKLDALTKEINQQNKKLMEIAEQFNQHTKKYNQSKQAFYDLANLHQKDIKEAGRAVHH